MDERNLFLILLLLISISACVSNDWDAERLRTTWERKIPTEPGQLPILEFEIGESVSDGRIEITVNSVDYVKKIAESEHYPPAEAPEGMVYAVLDITAENIQSDRLHRIDSWLGAEVVDNDGDIYLVDLDGMLALKNSFGFKESILPGEIRDGDVAYLIPKNSNLKLKYAHGEGVWEQAVFKLP